MITLYGYGGDDILDGGADDDLIIAGAGDDTVTGGAGSDALFGGDGTDTLSYASSSGNVVIDLSTSTVDDSRMNTTSDAYGDTISGFENVMGGAGSDTLTGDSGVNVIDGGAGNDRIQGGLGADTLTGGSGSFDILDYTDSTEAITVDLSSNSVAGSHASSTAFGDTISGFEFLYAGSGDDTLTGIAGRDRVFGYDGDDLIYGTGGGDRLSGGNGTDRLDYSGLANAAVITMVNGNGRAVINGSTDIFQFFEEYVLSDNGDTFTGGDWDDYVIAGGGADTIDGGASDYDTISYINSAAGVTVDLIEAGAQTSSGDASGDIISNVEQLIGSNFIDDLTGDSSDNIMWGGLLGDTLNGGSGNDTLYGEVGDDTLNGDSGNDVLYGGAGTNILNGGNGQDIIHITDDTATETIDGGAGIADILDMSTVSGTLTINLSTDTVSGSVVANKTISNMEFAKGSAQDDDITGTVGRNTLWGNDGADTLYGGYHRDHLFGGNGADTLDGGLHTDYLTGGAGADIFDYNSVLDSMTGEVDQILDFEVGTDQIDLQALVSDIATFGDLSITLDSGTTYDVTDAVGSSFAIKVTLTGGSLSASDFVFG